MNEGTTAKCKLIIKCTHQFNTIFMLVFGALSFICFFLYACDSYIWNVNEREFFLVLCCGLTAVAFLNMFIADYNCKGRSLSLFNDFIYGTYINGYHINIPLNSIASITSEKTLYDQFRGGETLTIRTDNRTYVYQYVHNAQEFIDKTMQLIKRTDTETINSIPIQKSDSSDEFVDKLKKLQSIREQGLITPEEYEEKRKELVSKL